MWDFAALSAHVGDEGARYNSWLLKSATFWELE